MTEPNSPEFERLYQENLARLRPKRRKVSAGAVKVLKARNGEEEAPPVKAAAKPKAAKTAATSTPSPTAE